MPDDPLDKLIDPLATLHLSLSMGASGKPEEVWPRWRDGGLVKLLDHEGVTRYFTLAELLAGLALQDIAALPSSLMTRLINAERKDPP